MLDVIQSCMGDVYIITCIAGYTYLGILFAAVAIRRARRDA